MFSSVITDSYTMKLTLAWFLAVPILGIQAEDNWVHGIGLIREWVEAADEKDCFGLALQHEDHGTRTTGAIGYNVTTIHMNTIRCKRAFKVIVEEQYLFN